MLSLNPWTLFWTVFNILILFLALKKFLIKPIRNIISQREEMIKKQFDEAQKEKNDAHDMKLEYENNLATANEQAASIITAAKARAEEEHSQKMEQTRAESAKMLEKAKADILLEQEQAKMELKTQIADIAMSAARKIIETGDVHDTGSSK